MAYENSTELQENEFYADYEDDCDETSDDYREYDEDDNDSDEYKLEKRLLYTKREEDDGLSLYIKETSKEKLLTAEEERDCIERYRKGDQTGKDTLIKKNLRLVIFFAKRYNHGKYPFEDLIQEGNIGLMRAVETYDPDKGRFTTYATQWIRQSIERYILNNCQMIRVPVHMMEQVRKYEAIKRNVENEEMRIPSVEEMADLMDVSIETAQKYEQYSQTVVSLDSPVANADTGAFDNVTCLMDFIKDDETKQPEYIVEQNDLKETLKKAMKECLTDREYEVISMRYGFDNGQYKTLEEVGDSLHVTRERVRQIEGKAILKLRGHKSRQILGAYLDQLPKASGMRYRY